MRKYEQSVNVGSTYLGQMVLTYPDEVVFVFNPLYVDIQTSSQIDSDGEETYLISSATVSVSTGRNSGTKYEVDVKLYKGHARVYVSRLMELFFDDVRFQRCKKLYVNIVISGTLIWSERFICIWGNLAVGERLGQYGAFVLDKNKPAFIRKRIWFKNFPFTVSMFSPKYLTAGVNIKAKYDGNPYDKSLYINYPPLWEIIDSLENDERIAAFPEEGVVADGGSLEGAVYDEQEKVFYGSSDDLCLCYDWTASPPYMPGPEEYNSNGKARNDKVWAMQTGRLMRFDSQLEELVEVPYGNGRTEGIFEVNPAITFPNAERNATYYQSGGDAEIKTSTFDSTFDYTFWLAGELSTITKLIVDNSTCGHYLRWIDRFGMYQYYLFTKGKETLKNKLGSNTVTEDYSVGGMYFANHERTTNIEGTKTVKVCANSLSDDIYGYVQTIVNSPVIDLYVGKTQYNDEMWIPCNIVAASHEYNPIDILHDLEISFTLPDVNAQTL